MKIKLGIGSLVAAAVMGVIGEIGSQIVSQKWDDIAEKKRSAKDTHARQKRRRNRRG